jgi:hypothetical protein
MTGEQKRYAVEAALLLGFQTETATFPVITADGEIPVPENMEELKALYRDVPDGQKVLIDVKGIYPVKNMKASGMRFWRL